jgi:hypothetical protein
VIETCLCMNISKWIEIWWQVSVFLLHSTFWLQRIFNLIFLWLNTCLIGFQTTVGITLYNGLPAKCMYWKTITKFTKQNESHQTEYCNHCQYLFYFSKSKNMPLKPNLVLWVLNKYHCQFKHQYNTHWQ